MSRLIEAFIKHAETVPQKVAGNFGQMNDVEFINALAANPRAFSIIANPQPDSPQKPIPTPEVLKIILTAFNQHSKEAKEAIKMLFVFEIFDKAFQLGNAKEDGLYEENYGLNQAVLKNWRALLEAAVNVTICSKVIHNRLHASLMQLLKEGFRLTQSSGVQKAAVAIDDPNRFRMAPGVHKDAWYVQLEDMHTGELIQVPSYCLDNKVQVNRNLVLTTFKENGIRLENALALQSFIDNSPDRTPYYSYQPVEKSPYFNTDLSKYFNTMSSDVCDGAVSRPVTRGDLLRMGFYEVFMPDGTGFTYDIFYRPTNNPGYVQNSNQEVMKITRQPGEDYSAFNKRRTIKADEYHRKLCNHEILLDCFLMFSKKTDDCIQAHYDNSYKSDVTRSVQEKPAKTLLLDNETGRVLLACYHTGFTLNFEYNQPCKNEENFITPVGCEVAVPNELLSNKVVTFGNEASASLDEEDLDSIKKQLLAIKAFNGKTIAEIEKSMQPGRCSSAGFLGPNDRLLDVIYQDFCQFQLHRITPDLLKTLLLHLMNQSSLFCFFDRWYWADTSYFVVPNDYDWRFNRGPICANDHPFHKTQASLQSSNTTFFGSDRKAGLDQAHATQEQPQVEFEIRYQWDIAFTNRPQINRARSFREIEPAYQPFPLSTLIVLMLKYCFLERGPYHFDLRKFMEVFGLMDEPILKPKLEASTADSQKTHDADSAQGSAPALTRRGF